MEEIPPLVADIYISNPLHQRNGFFPKINSGVFSVFSENPANLLQKNHDVKAQKPCRAARPCIFDPPKLSPFGRDKEKPGDLPHRLKQRNVEKKLRESGGELKRCFT